MPHILQSFCQKSFPEDELRTLKSACGLRRADRFTAMGLYAVKQAFPDTFPHPLPQDTGLITSSPLGPLNTTFSLLDNLLDFPEDQIQPTRFSHSVHNAAISYLTSVLELHGPAFALSNNLDIHESALAVAKSLLDARLCPQVLVIEINEQCLLTPLLPIAAPETYPVQPQEMATLTLLEY